jgi:hypothetical protein
MKGISLWQPWASLMALGEKQIETRSWETSYRGDLLITATARSPVPREQWPYHAKLNAAIRGDVILPAGCALCVVELYSCVPAQYIDGPTFGWASWPTDERRFGDYTPGRFAWLTRNLRALKTPIPCRGNRMLWLIEPDLLAQIEAQIGRRR